MKVTHNGIKYSISNYADLNNVNGEEVGTIVQVVEDGRAGTFVYKGTGIDDGGTIINGWHRVYDGAVNVKWFGVNVLDDILLNFKVIEIPNDGIYYINSDIEFVGTLIGIGQPSIVSNGTIKLINKYGNLKNLHFDVTAKPAIELSSCWNATIEDMYFTASVASQKAVVFSGNSSGLQSNVLRNCFFEGCGLYFSLSGYTNKNIFDNCTWFNSDSFIEVASSSKDFTANIFLNCLLENSNKLINENYAERQIMQFISSYLENITTQKGNFSYINSTVNTSVQLERNTSAFILGGNNTTGMSSDYLPISQQLKNLAAFSDERLLSYAVADTDNISLSGKVIQRVDAGGYGLQTIVAPSAELDRYIKAFGSVVVSFDAINVGGVSGIADVYTGYTYPAVAENVWKRYYYKLTHVGQGLRIYYSDGSSNTGEIKFCNLSVSAGSVATLPTLNDRYIKCYTVTTINPPSLNSGATYTTTINVDSAEFGDLVSISFYNNLHFCTLTASVSSSNKIDVLLNNTSGSTIDFAPTDIMLVVEGI